MNATTANPKKAQSRWWRHTARAVVIALIAVLVPGTPAVHADDTTMAGVCVPVSLNVSTTLTLAELPEETTTTFDGAGQCTTTTAPLSPTTGTLSGSVTSFPTPNTCAGGISSGDGSLTMPMMPTASFSVTVVQVGALVVMVMANDGETPFIGAGVFAVVPSPIPVPDWPVKCVTDPPFTSMAWLGAMSFAKV